MPSTSKRRRSRVPQRYYYAADILARVFRWHHIHAGRGLSWRLTFRVKALAKLAGIPLDGDARDTYLDALAVLQEQGRLDDPEVEKHTRELHHAAEQAQRWHEERQRGWEEEAPAPRASALDQRGSADAGLENLHDRLRRLLDEGEAHNESGVFRLRREIYDLERAAEVPSDDEWPEFIGEAA